MKSTQATVSDLHFFHKLWLNELIFFKRENAIFKARIEEIIKNTKFNSAGGPADNPLKEVLKVEEKLDALNGEIEQLKWMINQQDHQIWDMHPAHSMEGEGDIWQNFEELRGKFEGLKQNYLKNKKLLEDKMTVMSLGKNMGKNKLHNLPLYMI